MTKSSSMGLFHSWEEKNPLAESLRDDFYQLGFQFPMELSKAHPRRLDEYLAGRYCAQKALEQFGEREYFPIKSRESRAPAWPAGFIGSISHTKQTAWAVIARLDKVKAIGNDIEIIMPAKTAKNIQEKICTAAERAAFSANYATQLNFPTYVTLIFSAKESLYKALYPLFEVYFGFTDATLVGIDFIRGQLSLRLLKPLGDGALENCLFKIQFTLHENSLRTFILWERI